MTLPPLYLISDADRVGCRRFVDAAAAAFGAGLRMLQLREPGWSVERLAALVDSLTPALPDGCLLTVNWRPGKAASERETLVASRNLAGVHVGGCGADAVSQVRARRRTWLLGYSAHSVDAVVESFRAGADYVSFSPVFKPLSKTSSAPAAGLDRLREACRVAGPVYALGGIQPDRLASVREAGASGVAVIGAILDGPDPAAATRRLLDGWRGRDRGAPPDAGR